MHASTVKADTCSVLLSTDEDDNDDEGDDQQTDQYYCYIRQHSSIQRKLWFYNHDHHNIRL